MLDLRAEVLQGDDMGEGWRRCAKVGPLAQS